MRASFFVLVFSALATVSNVLAHPSYDDLDLPEREYAESSLETRSRNHDGPSATIKIHFRELMKPFEAREDLLRLVSRQPRHGPSATIDIHLRDLVDDGLELEERDYLEQGTELDARSVYGYDDELEEREFDDWEGELEAREDELEMEAREPIRHFRVGTVILPSSDDS